MSTTHDATARPGYALNEALLRANKSGRWLAEQIRTTEPRVSNYRNGLRPSEEFQRRIVDALSKELGSEITTKELGW
jgi:hypothetical protein